MPKKSKAERDGALGRDDIGRMLLTTSDATDGLTPRPMTLESEESKVNTARGRHTTNSESADLNLDSHRGGGAVQSSQGDHEH